MLTEYYDAMDVEYAATLSSRAIHSMSQLSVPATPSNFSVWFHYVLGKPQGLRKTIDILLDNKRKFDTAINQELYTTFVATEASISLAGDSPILLSRIIDGAQHFLADAIADNETQLVALNEVSVRVKANCDPRPIIETLISELTKANTRASALEMKLVDTTTQLGKVQLSLAEAEIRSRTDALTGLANRRALDAFFRTELIRALETGEPLSVLMIDVDHFKKFNDAHGHLIGDQVLRLVGKVLQNNVRDGDLASRYGGEELCAVLPGADLTVGRDVAERVRRLISDAKLTRRATGQEIGSITVSIGVAQFRLAERAEELIDRCDRGLYLAKSTGRNRVVTEVEIEDQVAA